MRTKTAIGYTALATGLGLMYVGNAGLALVFLLPALALFSLDIIEQAKESLEKNRVKARVERKEK